MNAPYPNIESLRRGLDEQAVNVLIEAAKLIGQSLDPATAIEGILKVLSEELEFTRGRVLLPNYKSNHLLISYSYGLNDAEIRRGVYALGEGVTGKVMANGEIALVPNVALEPTYLARVSRSTPINSQPLAYIAVPIFKEDKPIGVLAVHPRNSSHGPLTIGLFVLQIISQMISQVLSIKKLVKKQTEQLLVENKQLKNEKLIESMAAGLHGQSSAFLKAVRKASLAARSDAAVLLVGESGSGKEKFARMIHQLSEQRSSPFICINCAAIPEQLLESELFGHTKGSFTGASSNRTGKFEAANGGTLFLDEIGDMPLELQSKLLRVLQEKLIQKVGGDKEIPINVRIISATNKNLENAVNSAGFRLDLFYRLNVVSITLPPLRERKQDIKTLAIHFLNRGNQRYVRNIILTEEALQLLESYSWPGNIRQLENVIERAIIMADEDELSVVKLQSTLNEEANISIPSICPLPANGNTNFNPSGDSSNQPIRGYSRVNNLERPAIIDAIQKAKGNKAAAAKLLGMTSRQLHYRLRKLNISETELVPQ